MKIIALSDFSFICSQAIVLSRAKRQEIEQLITIVCRLWYGAVGERTRDLPHSEDIKPTDLLRSVRTSQLFNVCAYQTNKNKPDRRILHKSPNINQTVGRALRKNTEKEFVHTKVHALQCGYAREVF